MTQAKRSTGWAGYEAPAMHPLTHHDILTLMKPFTARDHHVDLAASDRTARRLLFKPAEREVASAGVMAREVLQLDNPSSGFYVLTRTLTLPSGLSAELEALGDDPGAMLARIEAMLPHQQFRSVEGTILALSYRMTSDAKCPSGVCQELLRGEAEIAGFAVKLRSSQVKGYPADVEITTRTPGIELPEDLIAVIGWAWSPLRKTPTGWKGTLKARGKEPELSRLLEVRLERTIAHLTHTLSKPPTLYHDSARRARWGVVLRRALPLLFFGGVIAGVASLTLFDVPEGVLSSLMMSTPGLMMFGIFAMRDTPSLIIPPFPRRLTQGAWLPAEATVASPLNAQPT